MSIHLFLKSKLSQWTYSPFQLDGLSCNCAEQWMMAQKAQLFGDEETFKAIMAVDPAHPDCPKQLNDEAWVEFPRMQQRLGRKVKDFDKVLWDNNAFDIVHRGNYAKFSQNQDLWKILDETGDKHLAEANPNDLIWGIGLGFKHPDARLPEKWPGKNWLGEVLMKVRAQIRRDMTNVDSSKKNSA